MTYVVREQLVASSKYKTKSPYSMTPKYITVHNTANDASAANEVAYHNRNDNQVSYHVAIDDKEAIICVPFNRNAWHCGDGGGSKDPNALSKGNRISIGVEICYSKSGGSRYNQAEANAAHYIATLLKRYGWGVDRLRQHYDWSRKNCPHRIRAEGRWESFVKRVDAQLKALDRPAVVEPPKTQVAAQKWEGIVLNETGRKAIRSIIKKAVADKTFSDPHKDVDKYTDGELLSYLAAYVDRKIK